MSDTVRWKNRNSLGEIILKLYYEILAPDIHIELTGSTSFLNYVRNRSKKSHAKACRKRYPYLSSKILLIFKIILVIQESKCVIKFTKEHHVYLLLQSFLRLLCIYSSNYCFQNKMAAENPLANKSLKKKLKKLKHILFF